MDDETLTDIWPQKMSSIIKVDSPHSWGSWWMMGDFSLPKVAFTAMAALLGGVVLLWWRSSGRHSFRQLFLRETKSSLGVLIIGGGSGIGAALSEEFKKKGDRVVIASRSNTEVTCDVRDAESIRRAIFLAKGTLGKIDLLVNMGAANQPKYGKLRDTTEHDIKEMVDTNVLGTLHVAREAALLLEPGSQVVLCGDAGTTSERSTHGYATLAYTKSGLQQLTKTLFAENKDKEIGFHLIVPGVAMTDFLHVEAQPKRAWWWFNVLGEKTDVQAEYFVPKMRSLKSATTPMTFEYLTGPAIAWRVATSFTRRNRFVDETTGAVKKH